MKPKYVIIEPERGRLWPLNLFRPSFELIYSFRRLLEWYEDKLGRPSGFVLPKRLHPLQRLKYPTAEEFDVALSSGVRPELLEELLDEVKDGEEAYEGYALLVRKGAGGIKKEVKGYLIGGPWELTKSLSRPPFAKSSLPADLPRNLSIDESKGPVVIEPGAALNDFVKIEGPALISKQARLSPFTRISGSYIGPGCRVGGEVERSVIEAFSNKPHYGFLGDSYVGVYVNIGAGATTSNLKNTYGTVRVTVEGAPVDTGEIKVGAFIGDFSRISINTSIMAGKIVGPAAYAEGTIRSDVPPFTFHGEPMNLKRFLEQARRFLERRMISLSEEEAEVIRLAYQETAAKMY